MGSIKLGTSVRIRKNSGFYGQQEGYGAIASVPSGNKTWYTVKWANGYSNSYHETDLEVESEWDQ